MLGRSICTGAAGGGGVSPTIRYTRLLAHGYEIGTAPATTIASGIADQMPMTLCQLKSRALRREAAAEPQHVLELDPASRPRQPEIHAAEDDEQEPELAAPVSALPVARLAPSSAM